VAKDVGLGRRTNMVMQAAFFALSGVMPIEQVRAGGGSGEAARQVPSLAWLV
jgi:Pyruvate/2-oxoacid:ferredoxin oxidoreductase gamma subunit